jgi:hypothetical protein
MDEAELFRQAGLPSDWADEFVSESNKIDPQPDPDGPGTVLYDGHREAVVYAIRMAAEDRYALPNSTHQLLLRDHPLAGEPRKRELKIGLNPILKASLVPHCLWKWNRYTHAVIDSLRTDDDSIDPDTKISEIWNLHCEFENIHPYELYNGKVGRILMVNHALLIDVEPWIIPCDLGREDYFDMIRQHPSAAWGAHPPEEEDG